MKYRRQSSAITITNVRKVMRNNPRLDPVNMIAYIQFGEILSICS